MARTARTEDREQHLSDASAAGIAKKVSVGVIVPGSGSEYLTDAEIVGPEGKRHVQGTAHAKLYGSNIPEGCPSMPYTMNIPVSCILWAEPSSEPIRSGELA